MRSILCLLVMPILFYSCTFVRTVAFFTPDSDDHEQIFSCDTVHVHSSTSVNWPQKETNVFNLEHWVPAYARLGSSNLLEFMEASKTAGLVVLHRDTVLFQYLKTGHTFDRQRIVFSVTKAITCILTAIAHEKGYIDMNQSLANFFPEFYKDRRKRIKIHHLMDMTSGLTWHDFNNIVRLGYMYYSKNLRRFVLNHTKVKHPPGIRHAYKSISTQILGMCLEKAIGISLAEFMEQELWSRLPMSNACYVTLDSPEKRNSRSFGGMAMSLKDMIHLGQLFNNHGRYEGKQLIPSWFMDSLTFRNPDLYHYGNKYCFKRNGYEEVGFKNNQAFWAAGFSGQFIYADPKHKIIIVRQGDRENVSWRYLLGRMASLIVDKKNDLTDSTLDKSSLFSGTYVGSRNDTIRLDYRSETDELDRKCWNFYRDVRLHKVHKKESTLYQIDGISIGYKSFSEETRLLFDVSNNVNHGFFYYTSQGISHSYYRKI